MSFWSGEKLLQNKSVIIGFDNIQVDANAYNLRMGDRYFITSNGESQTKIFLTKSEPFCIPPGQFAYLVTHEELNVPANAMAFISMRTGIKFQGLINVSGFHVDPGYKGKLIFACFNASPSPIQICEGESIFKLWFADLDRESAPEHIFTGNGKADIDSTLIRGMSKEVYSLQALAEKMRSLENSVAKQLAEQKPTIDNLTFVWRTIFLSVVAAILISVLTLSIPVMQTVYDLVEERMFSKPISEHSVRPTEPNKDSPN